MFNLVLETFLESADCFLGVAKSGPVLHYRV